MSQICWILYQKTGSQVKTLRQMCQYYGSLILKSSLTVLIFILSDKSDYVFLRTQVQQSLVVPAALCVQSSSNYPIAVRPHPKVLSPHLMLASNVCFNEQVIYSYDNISQKFNCQRNIVLWQAQSLLDSPVPHRCHSSPATIRTFICLSTILIPVLFMQFDRVKT